MSIAVRFPTSGQILTFWHFCIFQ